MIKVYCIGRLTKDVELRNGKDVDSKFGVFSLACSNTKEEATFLNCVAFNKKAETLSNYAKKGSLIGLTGSLRTREYQKQDGSKATTLELIVDDFQFLDSKPQEKEPEKVEEKKQESVVENIDPLADLPF